MAAIRRLEPSEVECRVSTAGFNSKGKPYATYLLYKDARVDMKILDEHFGPMNWQREHTLIGDRLYCTISIYDEARGIWIKKQDVGTESNSEPEKGQASDAFKRATFNVGIGRELYTSPFIWIQPRADMKPYNTKDIEGKEANEFYPYKKDNYGNGVYTTKTVFKVTEIGYTEENKIKDEANKNLDKVYNQTVKKYRSF